MTSDVLPRRTAAGAASVGLMLCLLAGSAQGQQARLTFQDRAGVDFNHAQAVHTNTEHRGTLQVRQWSPAERAAYPDTSGNTLLMHLDEAAATPGDVLQCTSTVPGLAPELSGSGGSDVRTVAGVLGNALEFEASTEDHVRLGRDVDLASRASAVTLLGWMRPESWPGGTSQADLINVGGPDDTRLALSLVGTDQLRATAEAPDSTTTPPLTADILVPPATGAWRLVASVFELSPTNRVSFYLDGRLLGVAAMPFSAAMTSATPSERAALGSADSYDSSYFDGALDEVSIWKRALTAGELRRIWSRQRGPYGGGEPAKFVSRAFDSGGPRVRWDVLGWKPQAPAWKGLPDEGITETGYAAGNVSMTGNVLLLHANGTGTLAEGAVVPDTSGQGHDAVYTAPDGVPARYVTGRVGEGLALPREGYLTVGGDAAPDFAFGQGDFTWAAWAKTSSCDGNNLVVMGAEGSSGQPHVWFGGGCETRCPDGRGWFVVRDSTGDVGHVCHHTRLDDGEWHHLVAVKSGQAPATLTLYVDGEPVTATHTYSGDFSFNRAPLLGQFPGMGYPTEASVDEVAIWRRALSAQEVRDVWRRGGTRLKLQVRACDEPTCAGVPFAGPDGTAATYFSEATHGTDDRPPEPGPLGLAAATPARYFQYAAYLETDSPLDTPGLAEVTAMATNSAPTVVPDTYEVSGKGSLQVEAPGLLGNDSDVEGGPLRVVLTAGPTEGTLQLGEDGSFQYTPAPGFSGTDRFRYRVSDGALESEEVEVVLTVSALPPPPVPGSPRIDRPAPGEVLHTRMPVLEGSADPDTRVELQLNGRMLGRVRADEQGRWSYTVTAGEALEVGSHRAVAYGLGVAQERSEPSVEVEFDIQPYDLQVSGCGCNSGGQEAPWLALLGLLALAALRRGRPA